MKRFPRWILLLVIPITLGLALFAFDLPRTSSDEMAPNLRKGDLLLACRLCGHPDRGDVVVFASPEQQGQLSIRRIVGGPGDRVEVRRGGVFVNGIPLVDEPGERLELPGLEGKFDSVLETVGAHKFTVIRDVGVTSTSNHPPQMLVDEYFVVADRRTMARDSRDYGPIKDRDIRSTVKRVLHAGDGDGTRQKSVP